MLFWPIRKFRVLYHTFEINVGHFVMAGRSHAEYAVTLRGNSRTSLHESMGNVSNLIPCLSGNFNRAYTF